MKDIKLKAKKEMLKHLSKQMKDMSGKNMMGSGMGVQVQAKDKKGLVKGLDKAKEIVESGEVEEVLEHEEMENEEMSQEEIKEQIASLQKMLKE